MRCTAWRLFRHLLQLSIFPLLLGCALEQCTAAFVAWILEGGSELVAQPLKLPEKVDLPLSTLGKEIRDSQPRRVRLRCVNWYGAHMQTMVVGGLHRQALSSLVRSIKEMGFNCLRLPYSLEMHLKNARSRPSVTAVAANPELMNLTVWEILEKTIEALASAEIMVILNNHPGQAMWCCSEDDGEGLWFSEEYSEEEWLRSLRELARHYRHQKYVIGFDLRNELRGIPAATAQRLNLKPGGRYLRPDWSEASGVNWAAAAARAGRAVLEEDPTSLIFVEGLDFATDLRGVRAAPIHRHDGLRGRVVYEAHDYCWYHSTFFRAWQIYWLGLGWLLSAILEWRGSSKVGPEGKPSGPSWVKRKLVSSVVAMTVSNWMVSYSSFRATLDERWGFLLNEEEAPVWLGEFGTNGYWTTAVWWMEVGEVLWLKHLLRYMREQDLGYAYWALNGDKSLGEDETFGLLQQDYSSLRHPWLLQLLP